MPGAALLSAHDGYKLVGIAATGADAIRAASTLQPDVLVMDIQMPDAHCSSRRRQTSGDLSGWR
jgi:AmiR/NasT family two-component response regulator